MELQQVRYFLATCEMLNFTRAAELCDVTQPALTKGLKLLEHDLGGDLFDRQARPLRLTDLGRHLQDKFQDLHDLKADISTTARLFSNLEKSTHTLGLISTIGSDNFFRFTQALQRNAPGIALSVSLVPQDRLEAMILNGDLEISFLVADHLSQKIKADPLYTESYKLVLPPSHRLAKKETVTLNDLDGIDYVHRFHCEVNDVAADQFEAAGVSVRTPLSTDQDAIALQMIEAGLGVSIMPEALIAGDVIARDIEGLQLTRTLGLGYLPGRELSAPAAVLRKVILQKFGQRRE